MGLSSRNQPVQSGVNPRIRHTPARRRLALELLLGATFLSVASSAFAWGDEGHEIVATIADHYLTSQTRAAVNAILATDTSGLTQTDIASEATWADRYRTSHSNTANWHYVDTEIGTGDIDAACFGHPPLPANTVASQGPAQACVVDKINQFTQELQAPDTSAQERLMALQFVLHFVGDEHQPLHSSDDNDSGGNSKKVSASGIASGNLHSYWDTAFVQQLGTRAPDVAASLIQQIAPGDVANWQTQTPRDWSLEAFQVAKSDAYGLLPAPNSKGTYALPASYVSTATSDVSLQLRRAGVRLAKVLNDANLSAPAASASAASLASPFGR
ncbi:S1/P1 nuclease [Burkholderia alba]|uniref:S1/P1 nuclease n=1 Tax=Burkholderia alba TaxID=2683677 RepID=UPI002B059606|nr:S1/P1 nuclease [Burkholderia alba]